MRSSSNRVGVDNGDGQSLLFAQEAPAPAASKATPESVDAARAQLQRELLRKKKAERRAHARQRAKKKAPSEDTSQINAPAPELPAHPQPTDVSNAVDDTVAADNNRSDPSQQPAAGSSDPKPELPSSEERGLPDDSKRNLSTALAQTSSRPQSPTQANPIKEAKATTPEAQEDVSPKVAARNDKDSSRKMNSNAAARKIQKAIKRKLRKRYHSFLRSSSKVFAEECQPVAPRKEHSASAGIYPNAEAGRFESSTAVTIESAMDLHELSNGGQQVNSATSYNTLESERARSNASLPPILPVTHQVIRDEGSPERICEPHRVDSECTEPPGSASCSSSASSSPSPSRSRSSSSASSSSSSNGESGSSSDSRTRSKCSDRIHVNEPQSGSPVGPPLDLIREAQDTSTTLEHAAVRLQAWVRGNQGRQFAHELAQELDEELRQEALDEIRYEASVHIQAIMRGYLVRRQQQHRRMRKRPSLGADATEPGGGALNDEGNEESEYAAEWPAELNLEPAEGWDPLSTVSNSNGDFVTHTEFLAKGKIRVFCGTWNMHAKRPRDDLRLWIGLNKYHIVAVGSEECVNSIAKSVVFTSKKQWEELLKDTLGEEYVMVASHSLTAIHNVVFAHNSIVPLLRHVQSDAVATGIGNQLGNKGGVGIAFTIGKTSFAFVNCHFDAHQHNVEKRNANFHRINKELRLSLDAAADPGDQPDRISSGQQQQTAAATSSSPSLKRRSVDHASRRISETFDRVFWFGDLNYRINGTRRMVDHLLLRNEFEVLHFNDQLLIEMKRGQVFRHFSEGPLHFRPTYKIDKHCNVYDSSAKQRIPSWTDRILYLSNQKAQDIEILRYASEPSFQTSDHRPVSAVFDVRFNAGRDAVQRGFSRVLAHGYKPTAPRSEACVVQ